MAATESEIIRDEQERGNLLTAISDLETAIAVSNPGIRRILENALDNARKRIGSLDKKIEDAKVERAAEVQGQLTTAAALAAKETALNAREREEYSGFLGEEFFTRKDFGKLAGFYAHSWDRLSEGGKTEMSHRVWEGVRHGEYRFDDLPTDVKEKEAKMAYEKLSVSSRDSDVKDIPETDRDGFLKAYRSGDQSAAFHILSRESFKKSMSLKTSGGAKHQVVTLEHPAENEQILSDRPAQSSPNMPLESSAMSKIKENAGVLGRIALIATDAPPSVAALPNAIGPTVNGHSPA